MAQRKQGAAAVAEPVAKERVVMINGQAVVAHDMVEDDRVAKLAVPNRSRRRRIRGVTGLDSFSYSGDDAVSEDETALDIARSRSSAERKRKRAAAAATGSTKYGAGGELLQTLDLPTQLDMFDPDRGEIPEGVVPHLTADSPLELGLWWFRKYMTDAKKPANTVASYLYDLAVFRDYIGQRSIGGVTATDVGNFLAIAQKKSTRKRRLTSLSTLFKYLIRNAKALDRDPTETFYSDFIPLKTPTTLTKSEQDAMLAAAAAENSRSHLIVLLLLKVGFTRTELLQITPSHVDLSDPKQPQVFVHYADKRWLKKERKTAADADFAFAFTKYVADYGIGENDPLFTMLPQSVNKLVERIAAAAEINKKVTPQSLRDTYAVGQALQGADHKKLMAILGLAPDPRNRLSVDRYIKLAAPSL